MLARERDAWSREVETALRSCLGPSVRAVALGGEEPGRVRPSLVRVGRGGLAALCLQRPDLVVSMGLGRRSLRAASYCALRSSAALLLCVRHPPDGRRRVLRAMLAQADAVLSGGHATSAELVALGVPSWRVFEVGGCLAAEHDADYGSSAQEAVAHRILFVGDLTPEAGVADLLLCARIWAEQNPNRQIEIRWAGEGDLQKVLAAQPLPANLRQHFSPLPRCAELAGLLADSTILAQPSFTETVRDFTADGLAAGLPVLGTTRGAAAPVLVQDGETGWLFDPFLPNAMYRALNRALRTPASHLARMGARARTWHGFGRNALRERVNQAVTTALAPRRKPALAPEVA